MGGRGWLARQSHSGKRTHSIAISESSRGRKRKCSRRRFIGAARTCRRKPGFAGLGMDQDPPGALAQSIAPGLRTTHSLADSMLGALPIGHGDFLFGHENFSRAGAKIETTRLANSAHMTSPRVLTIARNNTQNISLVRATVSRRRLPLPEKTYGILRER